MVRLSRSSTDEITEEVEVTECKCTSEARDINCPDHGG